MLKNENFQEMNLKQNGFKQGEKLGILMSGGPASGANAVISTFTALAIDNNYPVIGFHEGFTYLQNFSKDNPTTMQEGETFTNLQRNITEHRNRGGNIIGTARANPSSNIKTYEDLKDPQKSAPLKNVLDAFEYLGIGALVTIGGDDTLKLGNILFQLGVPTVHVPKTIDNDYFGIPWTFGYWTAVETARELLLNLKRDADTAKSWFIVELMGRKAGWITYGAGIAGESDLMLAREDFEDKDISYEELIAYLTDFIIEHEKNGKRSGVICLAEGLAEILPSALKPKVLDEHKNVHLSLARLADKVTESVTIAYKEKTGKKKKITPFNIGYDIRCANPNSFDTVMSSMLGYGAFKLLSENKFGNMVSVTDNFDITPVPFSELIDAKTLKTKNRNVPPDSDFYKFQRMLGAIPKR